MYGHQTHGRLHYTFAAERPATFAGHDAAEPKCTAIKRTAACTMKDTRTAVSLNENSLVFPALTVSDSIYR